MLSYKPKRFKIHELVHPVLLSRLGETNCWLRLDQGCLKDLDTIREEWGSEIYCNIAHLDSRGLRPPDDLDGSRDSVHKQGKAFDLSPKHGKVKDLYNLIIRLIKEGKLKSFNTVEDFAYTKTWVHVAKMNTNLKPFIIKP